MEVFVISRNDYLLTFTVERDTVQFGEGSRILFWIDLNQKVLQRGRQEAIPLDLIEGFSADAENRGLLCSLGEQQIILFTVEESETDRLQHAADELNDFCGLLTK